MPFLSDFSILNKMSTSDTVDSISFSHLGTRPLVDLKDGWTICKHAEKTFEGSLELQNWFVYSRPIFSKLNANIILQNFKIWD